MIHPRSTVDTTGRLGKFYMSLKVRLGGVYIYDPISEYSKVTYDLGAIGEELDKIFIHGTSKLGRVQEFEARAFYDRCRSPDSGECNFYYVLVTDSKFEESMKDELVREVRPLRQFADACKSHQRSEKNPKLGCFWLRLPRSPVWQNFTAEHFTSWQEGKPVAFMVKRTPQAIFYTGAKQLQVQDTDVTTTERARW